MRCRCIDKPLYLNKPRQHGVQLEAGRSKCLHRTQRRQRCPTVRGRVWLVCFDWPSTWFLATSTDEIVTDSSADGIGVLEKCSVGGRTIAELFVTRKTSVWKKILQAATPWEDAILILHRYSEMAVTGRPQVGWFCCVLAPWRWQIFCSCSACRSAQILGRSPCFLLCRFFFLFEMLVLKILTRRVTQGVALLP